MKNLIVLIGPSASGKTSLKKQSPLNSVVTYTSRHMRSGEENGIDYDFVSEETFRELIEKEELIEYTNYHGHYYGMGRARINELLFRNESALIILDESGCKKLKEFYKNNIFIIGVYASYETCAKRLRERGESNPEQRLTTYHEEIQAMLSLSDLIINTDLNEENLILDLYKKILAIVNEADKMV